MHIITSFENCTKLCTSNRKLQIYTHDGYYKNNDESRVVDI